MPLGQVNVANWPRFDHAVRLWRGGHYREFRTLCEARIADEPHDARALSLLTVACSLTGDLCRAREIAVRVISLTPNDPAAHGNLGNVLRAIGDLDGAIASYQAALDLAPEHADAAYNLGVALAAAGGKTQAEACYRRALATNPAHRSAWYNLGLLLRDQRRISEAIAVLERAVLADPESVAALNNLGSLLLESGQIPAAVLALRRAVALNSDDPQPALNLGQALQQLGDWADAWEVLRTALARQPRPELRLAALTCAAHMAHWYNRSADEAQLHPRAPGVVATTLLAFIDDPADLFEMNRRYCDRFLPSAAPLHRGQVYRHDRLRLAYLSADFHEHATSLLAAGLFEAHDRTKFEVWGVSYGPDDGSAMRTRLSRAFDRFLDVRAQTDDQVASCLNDAEIDIAIDLKGHTRDSRLQILAQRPAPIQVTYLGYPGTLGTSFIDYLVADETVIPPGQERFYSEKVVYLPECYQVNDRARPIAEGIPSRGAAGLPDRAFVYACFNATWKITPTVFEVWMSLLRERPDAVLWLLDDNRWAAANLRREADSRSIAPERIVFAPRIRNSEHLARIQLADLILDTAPCGAHTTAADALWAGVPLVTYLGRSFAGRVAGSLLRAVGLDELVVGSLAEYARLARRLAASPAELARIRSKLQAARLSAPLFDTQRLCRHLEAAYRAMHERHVRRELPVSFRVTTLNTEAAADGRGAR
jgi:predicted O-linked N-acetylglucosamine transferase (SPINDLY family)